MEKVTTFENRLREIMHRKGLRQVDLVRQYASNCQDPDLKLSQSLLSHYMNGRKAPTRERLNLLAATLGVRPSWLMGYDTEESGDIREPDALSAAGADDEFYAKMMNSMQQLGWRFEFKPESDLYYVYHSAKGVESVSTMDRRELLLKLDLIFLYSEFLIPKPLGQ